MGIYTGNRTQLGPDSVGFNEAYANPLGALMLVTESYHNDAVMFENVIMSDFLEAVSEDKSASNETKKNFISLIWDRIIKLIDMIKEKVNAIVERFIKMMDEFYAKNIAKNLKENRDAFNKADLSKVKIKGFKKFKKTQTFSAEKFKEALKDQVDFSKFEGKDAKTISDTKEKDKDAEKRVYGKLVGKGPIEASDFATLLFEDYFEKEETEMPFTTEFKKEILSVLAKPVEERGHVREVRKKLFAELEEKKTEAKRMQKTAHKMDKSDNRTNQVAVANACYGLVSLIQKISGNVLNQVMKCEKAKVATAYKAFNAGAGYKAKSESFVSNEYLDAVVEAAEFEVDMFFDTYQFEISPTI